jgi:hypothetical protein
LRCNFAAGRIQRIGNCGTSSKQQRIYEESERKRSRKAKSWKLEVWRKQKWSQEWKEKKVKGGGRKKSHKSWRVEEGKRRKKRGKGKCKKETGRGGDGKEEQDKCGVLLEILVLVSCSVLSVSSFPFPYSLLPFSFSPLLFSLGFSISRFRLFALSASLTTLYLQLSVIFAALMFFGFGQQQICNLSIKSRLVPQADLT